MSGTISSMVSKRCVVALAVVLLAVQPAAGMFKQVPELPRLHNWAGNVVFHGNSLRTPNHLEHLVDIVKDAKHLSVMAARHSFSAIGDSDEIIISLDHFTEPGGVEEQSSVRVIAQGGTTYKHLVDYLTPYGLALENVASLLEFTVAGAVATGTHGSGSRLGTLASQVTGIQADGHLAAVSEGADSEDEHFKGNFDGSVVNLGALGVITALQLRVVPTYEVELCVYTGVRLPPETLQAEFDKLVDNVYSVSLYTDWQGEAGEFTHVFMRHNLNGTHHPTSQGCTRTLHGRPKLKEHTPLWEGGNASALSDLGVGPWHEKLALQKFDALGHEGNELHSEYFVGRVHAADAMRAIAAIGDKLRPVLSIAEVRVVAADRQWLSPTYKRASVAFHFTWTNDAKAVKKVLPVLEAVLEPFEPRPHWGKMFTMHPKKVCSREPA